MAPNQELITKLIEKLEILFKKQAEFSTEINSLKDELYRLQSGDEAIKPLITKPQPIQKDIPKKESTKLIQPKEEIEEIKEHTQQIIEPVLEPEPIKTESIIEIKPVKAFAKPKSKSSLEKFIGENLLNKIGIIITIIGVAIGAKYSIENDLISPLTRIILGYVTALCLLGFGIKLKQKYESYSAVLVSGSIVILYFITFFAYSFYDLIPQTIAFVLMVIFTTFTVVAAISYDRQVIAHIGLVGAYAVPFLLSSGSGQIEVMFSYMAIINIGILIISFKRYWKSLYYSSFIFTWLIYASWHIFEYNAQTQFYLALGFLSLFFIIFYVTFLSYKMLKRESFKSSDVVLLLINSFLFYGFGYLILDGNTKTDGFLGLFTLFNAIVHFIVSVLFYKKNLGNKNLFYLASTMVLVFITITIPVQLNGNWVTLLWVTEAALLFWLGRSKSINVYEKLSYPLMALAFISLIQDWSFTYHTNYYGSQTETGVTPFFNETFLTSILFITAFGFIVWLYRKKDYVSALDLNSKWFVFFNYVISAILVITAYYTFRLEIDLYWDQKLYDSLVEGTSSIRNYDYRDFSTIWIINYSIVFVSLLSLINFKFIKSKVLEKIAAALTVMSVFVFLTVGLYVLSELRDNYLNPSEYYVQGIFYLGIRYVSFAFLALGLYSCYYYMKRNQDSKFYKIAFDIILHVSILWTLSSELIHWMSIYDSSESYKLGLSILWGVYSFLLIAFGIWKNKVYLRIGGMALFGITLVKLFLYDISHLNTISKTIVFMSLGILLLIISFLYNKYKSRISDDVND